MKNLYFIVFLFFTIPNFSQNNSKLDSLKNIIESTTNDSIKMVTYNNLRRATYYSDPKASKNFTQNYLETSIRLKDSFNIALGNFYLGNANVVSGNYDIALNFYLKSANYFEKVKDSSRISSVYNGIGAAYENSGNDSLSLKYFKKAQQISKSIGDLRRSAIALNNIGNIYKNRDNLKNAKIYMEQAVEDIKKTNRLQYIHPISLNLANTYVELKEYNLASLLYEEVLKTVDTIKDVYSYGMSLRGLGTSHIAKQEYSYGLKKIKKAYKKLKSFGFYDEAMATIPDLINAYELNNKYKKGFELSKYYHKVKDSIFSNEKDKNLSEALQKYETEKKDTELKLLIVENEKNEQQRRLYFTLAITGLFIASLLGFFGYKNREKNILLAKQKQLLEDSLDEKNILLKEVHHRVKNSFQIVSSLLYLQSENVEDKEAKLAIKEAENRVKSMVLVHQKLYNKDELVGINTKEYITDLVTDIFQSHNLKKETISYALNIEPVVLNIETITPLGLILNELIINVLKHAFTVGVENNSISVDFTKLDDKLVLKVVDNGKGFEGDIKQTSFGITLMKALSKQLKATLNYKSKRNEGTEAVLNISKFTILS